MSDNNGKVVFELVDRDQIPPDERHVRASRWQPLMAALTEFNAAVVTFADAIEAKQKRPGIARAAALAHLSIAMRFKTQPDGQVAVYLWMEPKKEKVGRPATARRAHRSTKKAATA